MKLFFLREKKKRVFSRVVAASLIAAMCISGISTTAAAQGETEYGDEYCFDGEISNYETDSAAQGEATEYETDFVVQGEATEYETDSVAQGEAAEYETDSVVQEEASEDGTEAVESEDIYEYETENTCGTNVTEYAYYDDEVVGEATVFKDASTHLQYTVIGDNEVSVKYDTFSNPSGEVIIPDTYNGYTVTEIANGAFHDKGLTAVSIPYTVRRIGERAFYYCSHLENVEFRTRDTVDKYGNTVGESDLREIGINAFNRCISINTLKLPHGVEYIGTDAFANASIIFFYMPYTITTIRSNAFDGFVVKSSIYYSGTLQDWCSISMLSETTSPNNNTAHSAYRTCLYVAGSPDGEVPGYQKVTAVDTTGIAEVRDCAFSNIIDISEVTISEDTKRIGHYAFSYSRYKVFTLSSAVRTIGAKAFYNSNIDLLKYNGSINDWVTITYEKEYLGWEGHPNLVCDELLFRTDNGYEELYEIELDDSVNEVCSYAFHNFPSCTKLSFSNSVKRFGTDVFKLFWIDEICFSGTASDWARIAMASDTAMPGSSCKNIKFNGSPLTEIVLDEDINVLAPGCFRGFTNVVKVKLNNVMQIGERAFGGCSSLTSVVIPDSVTTISRYAFISCNLESVEIGNGVAEIPSYAFADNKNLSFVRFSPKITNISGEAFQQTNIKRVKVVKDSYAESFIDKMNLKLSLTSQIKIEYFIYVTSEAWFAGCSGWFDGNVGLTIYLVLADSILEKDFYVRVTKQINGERYSNNYRLGHLKREGTYYTLDLPMTPKEVSSTLTVQVYLGDGTWSAAFQTSFLQYASSIIDSDLYRDSEGNEVPVVKELRAILTYCDAAQDYFDFYADTIDESYLTKAEDLYVTDFSKYEPLIGDSGFMGLSLVLDAKLKLRIYLDENRYGLWLGKTFKGQIYGGTADTANKYFKQYDGYTIFEMSEFEWGIESEFGITPETSYSVLAQMDYVGDSRMIFCLYSYFFYVEKAGDQKLLNIGNAIYNLNETTKVYQNSEHILY